MTCLLPAQNEAGWSEFQVKATAWRALAVKPSLPEEVQKQQAQAENDLHKKRLADAAAAYEAGLKLDPVWPEGQLQAAQLYAKLDEFDKAIWHMHAYVALLPNTPDAQSAPDEIALWTNQSKALGTAVFLDPASSLMWARQDSGARLTRGGAIGYCGGLNLGDFYGWRLPTSVELKTIYEKNKKDDNLACKEGKLQGARIRPDIQLSCDDGLVWQSDLPYSNAISITSGCFGFRRGGGQWEYAPNTLKCAALCVRDIGN